MQISHEPLPGSGADRAARLAFAISVCCAIGFRVGYFIETLRDPTSGYPNSGMYCGAPVGDGACWDLSALELANTGSLPEYWAVRRPLFILWLATWYVFRGNSIAVALAAHVVVGAIGLAAMGLAVGRALGPAVACALMLWLAIEPQGASLSVAPMSEIPGFTLFALHLLMLTRPALTVRAATWSGLLLGFSNVIRPITLFAVVPEALLLWCWPRGISKQARWQALALLLGTSLPIVGQLSWNGTQHGVWSLSDNSAWHFYSLMTDKYQGRWMSDIEGEAVAAGIEGTSERYHYFIRQGWKAFRANPTVALGNLRSALAFNLTAWTQPLFTWNWLFAALVAAVVACALAVPGSDRANHRRRTFIQTAVFITAAPAICSAPFWAGSPILGLLFSAFGWIAALRAIRERATALVGGGLVVLLVSMVMSLNREMRIFLFLQWGIVAGALFAGLAMATRFSGQGHRMGVAPLTFDPWPRWLCRGLIAATALFAVYEVAAVGGIAMRRNSPISLVPMIVPPTLTEAEVAVREVSALWPEVFSTRDFAQVACWGDAPPDAFQARLVLLRGLWQRNVYCISAHSSNATYGSVFAARPYPRAVFGFISSDACGRILAPKLNWPGDSPVVQSGKLCDMLVRVHPAERNFDELQVESIAFRPANMSGASWLLAVDPAHERMLIALRDRENAPVAPTAKGARLEAPSR